MTKQIRIYLFLFLATLLAGLPAYGQVGSGIITMTTARSVGEEIQLDIRADGDITIEGVKGKGVKGFHYYTITNQQIVIRGNITVLDCHWNQLASLDVSGCTALTELTCFGNQLLALDVSSCTALTKLTCSDNQLLTLDVSDCTSLTELWCSNNKLTDLDVSGCTSLTELWCFINKLTDLDVTGCTALTKLTCYKNLLTALDLSNNAALTTLNCKQNQLPALDVSGCTALTELFCSWNKLTNLNVSGCTALTKLDCETNQLPALDASGCTALTGLSCSNNKLTALDVSGCTALTGLSCNENKLTALDVSGCTALTKLYCYSNQIKGPEMSLLVRSLVNRPKQSPGKFVVYNNSEYSNSEGNLCYSHDVDLAREKNWFTFSTTCENTSCESIYNGKPSTKFSVTQTIEGEGTLNVIGAADLNAVLEDTELTIKDTPAEGYELTALTANETDILATKKIVVKGATEIKATFAKKNFTITLVKVGEGLLHATGADNLNAVEYGTELTIDATPADGYYLMALTANGTDILATPKVTVKEGIKVTAIFAKKTFGVTLSSNEYGSISIVESIDPDAVLYGTELTIKAQGKDAKCELMALTANGVDILATKKFVVTGSTVVKATFTKTGFAVTLTKEGEGTLNATGADDINAVPFGTELTIEATPEAGYELKELTANGADILATKKVVVKGATEIKATFAKKTFAVKLTKEGEGTLAATGADDLNAVPYGTELTIKAAPTAGYELTALTANGTDILATRKVVVKEATEVKATFAKKTFTVKLTKEGEGSLAATGADDLNAVPYGTELTIKATPAKGYTLVALTANGTDILTAKKFVVKGATEIKATFTKKTAADRVKAGSVRLYPNPASTYVNVKAAKADALVRLYDANGTLLYEARTDDHGILQIELSAYAEGTYLLLVDSNAQRLLIQR